MLGVLVVFKLLVIFVRLLGPIHGSKGVVGSSLSIGLSTLIASRVVTFVLLATWKSFMSTLFKCNHLLYCMLKFLGGFWIIVVEFFKLPLVFDPVGEVIYHLPVCDIEDLGSYFSKAVIILLEGFIRFLFASSKLIPSTWVGEDA